MGEPKNILVYFPIYSRNRFAMILKAIARAAKEEVCIVVSERDYVGNVLNNHPFTGMNYDEYYSSIVNGEGKTCYVQKWNESSSGFDGWFRIYAGSIHDYDDSFKYLQESDTSLLEICQDKCDEGLLGSNKATEDPNIKNYTLINFRTEQKNKTKIIKNISFRTKFNSKIY